MRAILRRMKTLVETFARQQLPGSPSYGHRWYYIEGLIMKGLLDIDAARGNHDNFPAVKRYVDTLFGPDGTMTGYDPHEFNIDQINMGNILFPLNEMAPDARYRALMDALYGQLLAHPRTECGSFWHKKIYPYQVWLDGLYMGQPFLVHYRRDILGSADFSDTLRQFDTVGKRMYDADRRLFVHAWDESRRMFWADKCSGLSLNVWGRACGWHVMALVDVLELLEGRGADTAGLRAQLGLAVEGLLEYQTPGGMWYQVVDMGNRRGNYLESSGSLMIAYAILKGVRLGYLRPELATAGLKAYEGTVETCLREVGEEVRLENICKSAGLGGDNDRPGTFDYYMAEPRVANNGHGIGALLLAHSEALRL